MDSRQLSLTRNASEATLLPLSEVEAKEKDVKIAVQQAVIQKKQEEILTQMELNVLRSAMISIGGPTQFKGVPVSERRMSYTQFKEFKKSQPAKVQKYLLATMFTKLVKDERGRASIYDYYCYVERRNNLLQARVDFAKYDEEGSGFLTETDLEKYMMDLLPKLNQKSLGRIARSQMCQFWVHVATRKVMFFLDKFKRGKIPICDLILSPVLAELNEMKIKHKEEEEFEHNWFNGTTTERLCEMFHSLDTDNNGLLSLKNLYEFNGGTVTKIFIERFFQECHTLSGQIDFKAFVDFVIAQEHNGEPEAQRRYFQLLDLEGCHYLDEKIIRHHFNCLSERLVSFGQEPVPMEELLDDIFTMANTLNQDRIYLRDIQQSSYAPDILSIMTDCRGYHKFMRRNSGDNS